MRRKKGGEPLRGCDWRCETAGFRKPALQRLREELGQRLLAKICGVGGNGERGVAAFVADGSVSDEAEGNDASPDF